MVLTIFNNYSGYVKALFSVTSLFSRRPKAYWKLTNIMTPFYSISSKFISNKGIRSGEYVFAKTNKRSVTYFPYSFTTCMRIRAVN